jgi:ABC-type thiamin/hydroxymethylpyrimidine transport system permease subunit
MSLLSRSLPRLVVLLTGVALLCCLVAAPVEAHTKPTRSGFAGYQIAFSPVASTTATFTLPSFTCTKKKSALSIQLDAYDAEQSGFSYEFITLGCSKKVASYSPTFSVMSLTSPITSGSVILHAHDTVVFSITCGATGSTATMVDVTTDSTETDSSSTASLCSKVYVGDFGLPKGNGALENLPAFGAVPWTNVLVNGLPLGSLSPPPGINYYEGKKNVIDAGPLTDGGTAFTNTQGT